MKFSSFMQPILLVPAEDFYLMSLYIILHCSIHICNCTSTHSLYELLSPSLPLVFSGYLFVMNSNIIRLTLSSSLESLRNVIKCFTGFLNATNSLLSTNSICKSVPRRYAAVRAIVWKNCILFRHISDWTISHTQSDFQTQRLGMIVLRNL